MEMEVWKALGINDKDKEWEWLDITWSDAWFPFVFFLVLCNNFPRHKTTLFYSRLFTSGWKGPSSQACSAGTQEMQNSSATKWEVPRKLSWYFLQTISHLKNIFSFSFSNWRFFLFIFIHCSKNKIKMN
jgi:hypothetical protein